MKKFLITILLSFIIGGSLAFMAYRKMMKVQKVSSSFKDCYILQGGVFKTLDNANNMADNYGGVVFQDNDYYRVYLAILTSDNTLSLVENYYDKQNISYYPKKINIDSSLYNTLNNYEMMLLNVKEEQYKEVINQMLKEYEKTL